MFLAHSFRLRAPWQCACTLEGATRWSRVFHLPTGLEPDDALWLVCAGLPPNAEVTLNGMRLQSCSPSDLQPPASSLQPHTYEVTPLIADTNTVELLIPSASEPPASQPPTASGRQPTADSQQPTFPYDIRLGIIGHS